MIRQELSRKGGEEDSLRAVGGGTGWICKLSTTGCGYLSVGTGWALFCKPLQLPSLSASAVGHPIFPQVPRNPHILTLGPAVERNAESSVASSKPHSCGAALRGCHTDEPIRKCLVPSGPGGAGPQVSRSPGLKNVTTACRRRTSTAVGPSACLTPDPVPPALGNGSRKPPHVGVGGAQRGIMRAFESLEEKSLL